MKTEFFEHIALFKNVYPDGYCQHLISEFDALADKGAGIDRQKNEGAPRHIKQDHQLFLNARNHDLGRFNDVIAVDVFFNGLQKCYEEYCETYSVLQDSGQIRATAMKMQRIDAGGGYHIWHCEQGGKQNGNRVLVYMLYLNSLPAEDGAETEFLYQKRRFNPVENTMVLWPAAYTHAHRGNPVLGNASKYIVTGWFYYE